MNMAATKLKRNLRSCYRRYALFLFIALLTIIGFVLLENQIGVNNNEKISNKFDIERKQFSMRNDEPKFPEAVDDQKFVLKNLETNIPGEKFKVIKIDDLDEEESPNNDERTAPKRIFKDKGKVDVHVWDSMCSFSINSLRQSPLFPLRAKSRKKLAITDELKAKLEGSWLSQRIMGYLHPPVSGNYQFELSSFFMAELWISKSEDPKKSSMVSKITRNKLYDVFFSVGRNSPKSDTITLMNGTAYYFEILHVINDVKTKEDHVRLSWKLPDFDDFTSIKRKHVSAFLEDEQRLSANDTIFLLKKSNSLLEVKEDDMTNETQHGYNMDLFRSIMAPNINTSTVYTRENVHTLPYLERKEIIGAFLEGPYEPSYTKKITYKRYEGVYNTHFTDVFPNDGTRLRKEGYKDPTERDGNHLIEEKEVFKAVKMFMEGLDRKYPKKYLLVSIINVERNIDAQKGTRYFFELALRNTEEDKVYRIAEYMFIFTNQPKKLLIPKGMAWKPNVTINVILTVKNQGDWAINFIEEMSRVKELTNDNNLNFIVVDYGGDGVDLKEEFKRSILHNFTMIHRKGAFHKTSAINEAASKIKDPNSIVFLMDLHLRMPNNIFDSLRKHTIQGLMSFTPVVFRLQFCGRPGSWNTYGSGWWETSGYGLFSIYKSDWDKFGGMNVKEFTNKWGGEDWEMVDRVLANRIEIERLRVPELYHFFHDKSRMWDKSGSI